MSNPPFASAAAAAIKPLVEVDSVKIEPVVTETIEIGGRDGPDPVRYGDWEKNGRCIDF